MKFFLVFIAGFCAVSVYANPAVVNTGHSAQFRSQDSLGNYAFGYNEDHATGGTFRRETGSPGMAQGSYGLRTIDGRVRVVNYVADGHGFRANIQTNEPGVDPEQDPASVLINKAAAIVAPYLHKQVALHAEPAPIAVQHSELVGKYEPAPVPLEAPHYAPSATLVAAAPALTKYSTGPYLESAPLLTKYQSAPLMEAVPASAPVPSTYTTKTYASPAPILSSDSVYPLAASLLSASAAKAGYEPVLDGHAGPVYDTKLLTGYSHLKK